MIESAAYDLIKQEEGEVNKEQNEMVPVYENSPKDFEPHPSFPVNEPIKEEEKPTLQILGKATILAIFEMKEGRIAGCKVLEGKIQKNLPVLIQRGKETLGKTQIVSLKEKKQDINEATSGSEFGAIFADKLDFQVGDMVLSVNPE